FHSIPQPPPLHQIPLGIQARSQPLSFPCLQHQTNRSRTRSRSSPASDHLPGFAPLASSIDGDELLPNQGCAHASFPLPRVLSLYVAQISLCCLCPAGRHGCTSSILARSRLRLRPCVPVEAR
uniref:Uncharacterized protein n=1 Tax=Triticum urartu TaxID=4572 RepID=A0A8R7K1G6_TRIUA